tara:strand:- start:5700 stop:6215 length:516 start_codon:yes stop_codon:yes gene_type:complete
MKVNIKTYPKYRFWYSWFGYAPEQKIQVKIESWDTWSMDHTLGHIILPMLVQLKATKHGAPCTDDKDVPKALRSTNAPAKENKWDTDANHFNRWDWILDEMIWAFNEKCRDNWEADFYEYKNISKEEATDGTERLFGMKLIWEDKKGRKAHAARMANGFALFGKYYENLWD